MVSMTLAHALPRGLHTYMRNTCVWIFIRSPVSHNQIMYIPQQRPKACQAVNCILHTPGCAVKEREREDQPPKGRSE